MEISQTKEMPYWIMTIIKTTIEKVYNENNVLIWYKCYVYKVLNKLCHVPIKTFELFIFIIVVYF